MTCCKLVQRINMAGIRKDDWFKKNYLPVRKYEDEDVNLDDVQAVFNDFEVCQALFFRLLLFSYVTHIKGNPEQVSNPCLKIFQCVC
jgi:hypothetical protein